MLIDQKGESEEDIKQKQENARLAEKWLGEISRRRSKEKKWREKARKVLKRYRDDRDLDDELSKYNILYANTETIKPAIFSRMPVADVRRRYSTKDPVARTAALILERALSYCMSTYDFEDCLNRALEDYVLPGRGQLMVCYEPLILTRMDRQEVKPYPPGDDDAVEDDSPAEDAAEPAKEDAEPPVTGEDGQSYPPGTQFDPKGAYAMQESEYKAWESVYCRYVPWDLFGFSDCVQWTQVPAVWLGQYARKDELKDIAPDFQDLEALNFAPATTGSQENTNDYAAQPDGTVLLWKVWHRASRRYMVFAEGYTDGPLRIEDDPQQLEDFFPMPEPIYSLRTNGDWTPKPEYTIYQDQAIELDNLTNRLTNLTQALKVRGVYDSSMDSASFKLKDIVKEPDNTLMPVPNFREIAEKGGIENLISFLPLDEIASVIERLKGREAELKQMIYEVYGIADIMRGASEASETLGAQQLKAQYGSLRISQRQKRFQRFVRDILRIKAELIAEHFSPDTLRLMTGIQVMDDAQFQQLKQQDELPAGAVSQSEFMGAVQMIKSDRLRGFNVDIETDSTVPVDKQADQQNRIQFITAVGQYLQGIIPAVQMGAIPAKVAREGLLFVVRGFKVGTELEEVLEELGQEGDQGQQLAQLQQANQQMQQQLQQAQQEMQQMQQELQAAQSKQGENVARAQADIAVDNNAANNDIARDNAKATNTMAVERFKAVSAVQQANSQPASVQ